jgi:2-(1,2-epoxy-1,2-dihydrophenyl)acetyl-CoA isomerase
MSDTPTVRYEVSDAIATITLNRPEVYNAFNAQLHRELIGALRQAERDPAVRCVVLTGAGKAFCSGQDLKEFGDVSKEIDIGARIRELYNPLIRKLRGMSLPVIAAVNGPAAGAGMSLALACDLRVAAEGARFSAAFVGIGLIPDSGMIYFLPRLVGHARAFELCATGAPVDAATALQWGLVNAVASAEEFPAAVRQLAERLAGGPATAIGLIKRALEMSQQAGLDEVLEYEAQAQQVAGASPDFPEGVAAFREKRRPRWV